MKRFKVLLPHILLEGGAPHFGIIYHKGMKYAVIDEVSFNGDADDARQALIDHDGYSNYIILFSV